MGKATHLPAGAAFPGLRTVGTLVSQSLERVLQAERRQETDQDMTAINDVVLEIAASHDEQNAIPSVLDTIRADFGWEYGSFWAIDPEQNVLRNANESGSAGAEFRQVTRQATFAKGVGVAGRTWSSGDLVFEPDLGVVDDCVRAPAAQRAGMKSGVCLPIRVTGEIIGTIDFFATHTIVLTTDRTKALKSSAELLSNAVERHRASRRVRQAGEELMSSPT